VLECRPMDEMLVNRLERDMLDCRKGLHLHLIRLVEVDRACLIDILVNLLVNLNTYLPNNNHTTKILVRLIHMLIFEKNFVFKNENKKKLLKKDSLYVPNSLYH
jgi:hypothetical protein